MIKITSTPHLGQRFINLPLPISVILVQLGGPARVSVGHQALHFSQQWANSPILPGQNLKVLGPLPLNVLKELLATGEVLPQLGGWGFEEGGGLDHDQALVNVIGVLLDLIHHRLKLGYGLE